MMETNPVERKPTMMRTLIVPAAIVALVAAACAPPPAAAPAPASLPDRTERPGVGPVPELRLPEVEHFRLVNGLEVVLMERHDVPLVQMNLLVRAGSVDDPAGREGLATLAADMVSDGAAGRSALEIADAFEQLGARFFSTASEHATTLGLRAQTARLPEALTVLADVVLRPDFPAEELERRRTQRITGLIRRHDEPAAIAGDLLVQRLYGDAHPYGRLAGGSEGSLRAMERADLEAFHRRYYRPGNATLVVVGALQREEARRLLQAAFGGWDAGETPARQQLPAPGQVQGRTVYLVDNPGAAQSVIQIGRIGVPRSTEDYFALEVMNTILGGSFTSRLNQNLREDKGYTYGARSAFDYRPEPGPFAASAAVQTDVTGPALREFMVELRRISEPIPPEEVALARNFLAMRYPAGFQSVSGTAGRLVDMVLYDLPEDYLERYTEQVLSVTAEDVARVAREYIDPASLAIVVVGDRSVVEEQIRAEDLGPVTLLEVTDVLGAVPVLRGGS
jgi:zinc protease